MHTKRHCYLPILRITDIFSCSSLVHVYNTTYCTCQTHIHTIKSNIRLTTYSNNRCSLSLSTRYCFIYKYNKYQICFETPCMTHIEWSSMKSCDMDYVDFDSINVSSAKAQSRYLNISSKCYSWSFKAIK